MKMSLIKKYYLLLLYKYNIDSTVLFVYVCERRGGCVRYRGAGRWIYYLLYIIFPPIEKIKSVFERLVVGEEENEEIIIIK